MGGRRERPGQGARGEPGRPGVIGATGEIEPPAAVRPDAFGQAQGGALRGERAALLDVQFDEGAEAGQQVVAGAEVAGVLARGDHGVGQHGAGVVGEDPRGIRVDGTGQQAAAQARDAEPRAFFLGEGGKHHGPFGRKGFVF